MRSRNILSRVPRTALPVAGFVVLTSVATIAGADSTGDRARPSRASAAEPALASTRAGEATAGAADDQLRRSAEEAVRTSGYLGVFDYVVVEVNGGYVRLRGSVEQRHRGEKVAGEVAALTGLVEVSNDVQVQTSAPADVQLRRRLFERLYYGGGIPRGERPDWPVRILVSEGRVTLAGELPASVDRARLEAMAWEAGAFFVEVQLHAESPRERQAADHD
jgi:osmotically-inducible protein OsmY